MTKIQYAWDSFSILEMLTTFIPFRAKRYVMKWCNIKKHLSKDGWIDAIMLESTPLGIKISLHLSRNVAFIIDNPIEVYGMSFNDAWQQMLSCIAKLENMRDPKELCAWIDAQA